MGEALGDVAESQGLGFPTGGGTGLKLGGERVSHQRKPLDQYREIKLTETQKDTHGRLNCNGSDGSTLWPQFIGTFLLPLLSRSGIYTQLR